ncbi:MAG TPA: hypothetical protein VGF17_03795, partial [Phytomonospora sp.]
AARKAWVAAEDEYHAACAREQVEYPVLAAYTKQDDAATRLFDLVGKSKQGLAASLYSTIDERLKSIKEVREAIGTKDYNPWKHSRVVGLTKTQMALAPWEARIVDERAAASAKGADASMVAKIAAVVSIGLGLLGAIPSGGGTLLAGLAMASAAVGAAFSLNNLYEHYKDYSLAKAENMMSLDQAQAISTDEPGLLWLALDLIDLGLSFTGAMDAFKKLRTAMALVEKGGVKAMIGLNAEMGRAALPPTTRGRLFAALFEKLGGGRSAAEALEQLLAQIAAAAEKDGPRQALAKAVDGAAVNLVAGKKIAFYLPGNAGGTLGEFKRIVRASGQVPAAEVEAHAIALMRDFGRKNYHGFYSGRADFIILRAGDDMASALTHELAHRAQSVKGRLQSLGTLRAEFQSHRMQREMLLALPEEIVAKSASKELVHKTDEEIIAFLKQHPEYGPKIKLEAADATIAQIDPAGDAKMVEDWFLDGTVGK